MTDAALADYFLASRQDVAGIELLEITHPNFTQAYRIARNTVDPNDPDGVTVDLSPSERGVRFQYWPARFQARGARDDLDFAITINLGDLGEVLPLEVDAVSAVAGFRSKPVVRYWVFRSDDLRSPILGPIILEGPSLSFDGTTTTLEARAPSLNSTKTGERYKLERFPMLRGFVK